MIVLKTKEEIEIMREAAQIVSRTLGLLASYIKPGITPIKLDEIAEEYIRSQNALPGFKGLYGCPSTLLTSVNEQVVHGLPGCFLQRRRSNPARDANSREQRVDDHDAR